MTNKERFKANIRMVELEQHSFCNRRCWFCPNQFIDRMFKPVKFMDFDVFTQILNDLSCIDYDQIISFSGNCEPFSQLEFVTRVEKAHIFVPNACLITNTNTDYLNTGSVELVSKAGLNLIKAQLYFNKDEEYTTEAIHAKMDKLVKKLPGIEFLEIIKNQWFALIGDMVIHAYSKDWHKVGHNRCDVPVRPAAKRMYVCGEGVQYIGVNYLGQVSPCCNIRGDYIKHESLLLGTMDSNPGTLFDLYQGLLLSETEYPCDICNGKGWHANGKIVHEEILKELKSGKYTGSNANKQCPSKGRSD